MHRRAAFLIFASLLSLFALAAGCGRSALDGYDLALVSGDGGDAGGDARPDGAPSCNPATCPKGCCDDTGSCVPGGDELSACGSGGRACVDCLAQGFDTCDPDTHSCSREVTSCDQASCPNGCCLTTIDGQFCVDGTSPDACGDDANTCVDCTTTGVGNTCDPLTHSCTAQTCYSNSCSGCCTDTGECHTGTDQTICGNGGNSCTDCTATGGSCDPSDAGSGGSCVANPPTCNSVSCSDGCCVGPDTCVHGVDETDNACGLNGVQCENCGGEGKICQSNACTMIPCAVTCTTSNGCCSPDGVCHAGFLNNACGEGGAACVDCGAETCDVNTRMCEATSTCPSAYASCDPSVTTTAPASSTACASEDLAEIASACSGGAHTSACQAFFSFEASANPGCGTCLAQFDFDFNEGAGIYKCVEPDVSNNCNHNTGCATDCSTQSCASCTSGNEPGCESQVRTGQCLSYYQQSLCVATGLRSASGRVCNPLRYSDVGEWLAGVGGQYCSP
ncbi:MAG: hypothetical protein ACRELY_03025 [Polyangiaceae bacterium]